MSEVKRFTRIVTDAAGGSTFQDDEFLLDASQGAAGMFTGTVPAASVACSGHDRESADLVILRAGVRLMRRPEVRRAGAFWGGARAG
jgi:hypothetical protein